MDMVFENQMNCQEKIEHTENDQDEVEIAFDDLDDSNAIALNLDSSNQYQIQGESVTYRLVQLTSPDEVQHILSSLSSNQTVQQNTSNNSGVTLMETNAKSYIQTATLQDSEHLNNTNSSNKRQVIVLTPQQLQQNGYTQSGNTNIHPKTIIPKNVVIKTEPLTKTMKDDRRRFTHKEVERRRRDKINMWIVQLGNLIPECFNQQPRQADSKGGILSKACDYITELQSENTEMEESLKGFDEVKNHLQLLNQQFAQLKQENQLLRSHLQQQQHFPDHGLITEGGDGNTVVLIDGATMVMEGSDNNNNFIGKYNFLSNNTDEDGLYVESLPADNTTANLHNENAYEDKQTSHSVGLDDTDSELNVQYQSDDIDTASSIKSENNPITGTTSSDCFVKDRMSKNGSDSSSNVGSLRTIIIKNIQGQKKPTGVIRNQMTNKKIKL